MGKILMNKCFIEEKGVKIKIYFFLPKLNETT